MAKKWYSHSNNLFWKNKIRGSDGNTKKNFKKLAKMGDFRYYIYISVKKNLSFIALLKDIQLAVPTFFIYNSCGDKIAQIQKKMMHWFYRPRTFLIKMLPKFRQRRGLCFIISLFEEVCYESFNH